MATLLEELQSASPSIFYAVRVLFPGATRTYTSYKTPFTSTLYGHAEPRILSMSDLTWDWSDRLYSLIDTELSVEIEDSDGDLSAILASKNARFATAYVFLSSPNVPVIFTTPPQNTMWVGGLDSWRPTSGGFGWELKFRSTAEWINGRPVRPQIHEGDWPTAEPGLHGKYAPVVFGTWSSSFDTNVGGMLPALPVVTGVGTIPTYMLAAGRIMSVTNLFDDDKKVIDPSVYSLKYPVVHGVEYSIIEMIPDDDRMVASNGTFTTGDAGIAAQPVSPSPATVWVVDANSSITEFVVTFEGVDGKDEKVSAEYRLSRDGKQWESETRFHKFTSIARSEFAGTSAGDTWRAGVSYRQKAPYWDGTGYDSAGDGTGSLVSKPVDQMRLLLQSRGDNPYKTGKRWQQFGTDTVPEWTSAGDFFDAVYPPQTAFYLAADDTRTLRDLLNSWAKSLDCPVLWSPSGGILALPWDYRMSTTYPTSPVLRRDEDFKGPLSGVTQSDSVTAEVNVPYLKRGEEWLKLTIAEDSKSTSLSSRNSLVVDEVPNEWVGNRNDFHFRNAGYRRVNRFRQLHNRYEFAAPFWMLAQAYNSIQGGALPEVLIAHDKIATAEGDGTLSGEDWKLRRCRVLRIQTNLEDRTCMLTVEDLRDQLCTFWHTAHAVKPVIHPHTGIAALYVSSDVPLAVSRTGSVYLESPGGANVFEVTETIQPYPLDKRGNLVEPTVTNYVLRSSFFDGTTGWTATGSPAATLTADTADPLLFDKTITPQCLKIVAGAARGGASHLCDTVPSGNQLVVSFDYRCGDGTSAPEWNLQRTSDGFWWNDSSGAFQSGAVNNSLSSTTLISRVISKQIPSSGSNQTYTFGFSVNSSKTGFLYHAQIEGNRYATSRILTTGAIATRNVTNQQLDNDDQGDGFRSWPLEHGTFEVVVEPLWNFADLASGALLYVFRLLYDANNIVELYYSQSNGRWEFKQTSGGTPYTAHATHSPVRGTRVHLAGRWTGSSNELGLTSKTMSLFVDGVKGTDVTYVSPNYLSSKVIYLGTLDGTSARAIGGAMIWWRITPWVYSDLEIARRAVI